MTPTEIISQLRAAVAHIERAINAECHGDCRWSVHDAGEYIVTVLRRLGAEADATRIEKALRKMGKAIEKGTL